MNHCWVTKRLSMWMFHGKFTCFGCLNDWHICVRSRFRKFIPFLCLFLKWDTGNDSTIQRWTYIITHQTLGWRSCCETFVVDLRPVLSVGDENPALQSVRFLWCLFDKRFMNRYLTGVPFHELLIRHKTHYIFRWLPIPGSVPYYTVLVARNDWPFLTILWLTHDPVDGIDH